MHFGTTREPLSEFCPGLFQALLTICNKADWIYCSRFVFNYGKFKKKKVFTFIHVLTRVFKKQVRSLSHGS